MDGFDDLLAPTQRTLEANPFADPFAKRSGSPDPWASFTPHSSANVDDPYRSEFHHDEPTTPKMSTSTFGYGNDSSSQSVAESSSQGSTGAAETIESASEDDTSTSSKGPGFRESIVSSTYSQTESIRNLAPEELASPPESQGSQKQSTTPPISSPPSSPQATTTDRLPSRSTAPASIKSERAVASPLDQAETLAINRPFASLALGGESLGGWQGTESTWVNDAPTTSMTSESVPEGESTVRPSSGEVDDTPADSKNSSASPPIDKNGLQSLFVISVEDPQKVGDPIRSFTMYTVHTRTTSPLFQKSAFSVLRRYSDFLWLYETLSMNNPGVVVPPVPEKSPFGRFDDQFVQQRRLALEKCIQKAANHPVLCKDTDLKMFLESDTFALDIKQRKAEIAHERGGLMASIGQTIAGPRFHESDEWFDRQKSYLDTLESQLRGLVKAIDVVAKHRIELSIAIGEFAHAISELSTSDVGKQLSHSLSSMADVEHKAQDLYSVQSQQDVVTIMSIADEYARLINSVRMAFSSRVRTYYTWQQADGDVRRVKQSHEKNRAQGRIPAERMGYSLSQIAEAERRCLEAKHDFDNASKLIKIEVSRFEQERIEDFRDSLRSYLEGMISRQKEIIASWESYQQLLLKKMEGAGSPKQPSSVSISSSLSSVM